MNGFYYRNLNAYNLAKKLVIFIYQLLNTFPKEEKFALCDQLRRAAISIPSNIAEGMGRNSVKERIHFIEIGYGSLMETMCQLEIALELKYISSEDFQKGEDLIKETAMTMSGLRNSLMNRFVRPR